VEIKGGKMGKFSKRSLDNLTGCHPDLVKIANLAIQRIDFTIIEEFYRRREKVALMYMKFNKNTTLKEIEKKIDEILEKLEKYNKENKSLDIRNEYADTRYRRKKAKPKIKRVSIRR